MKETLLLATLFLTFLLTSYAQDYPDQSSSMSEEERAKSMAELIVKQIPLAIEQQSAVRQIWTEFFTDMESLWQLEHVSRSSLRKSLQELEQIRDVKMKGILDEKQYTQYVDFIKAIRPSGRSISRRGN